MSSISIYEVALRSFDWHFEYSDDFRVWQTWSNKKRDLVRMQKLYDEHYVLWNAYAPKEFQISVENTDFSVDK